jgi:hypothetical protein
MTQPSSNPVATKRKSTLAALSLVFSYCSIITPFFVGSIAGTICGHMAMKQLKRDPELEGRQRAKWGLIIGYAMIVILPSLVLLFTLLFPHFE